MAAGELTEVEIAAQVGITDRQLRRWRQHPAFAQRVEHLVAAFREEVRARGIADCQNRLDALNDRWEGLQRVIVERATAYQGRAPGAETGLLARTVKLVKLYGGASNEQDQPDVDDTAGRMPGDDLLRGVKGVAIEVEEFAVDTGLLKALLDHEKQPAQELGQWAEKHEVTGDLLVREYVGIRIEDV